jgi:hypothetical protein
MKRRPAVGLLATSGFAAREAFAETEAERAALAESELLDVNLDLEAAIATALKTEQRLQSLLPELRKLPIDLERIERLGTYARAAMMAHTQSRVAVPPRAGLEELYREAIALRQSLRSDHDNLVRQGVIAAHTGGVRFSMGHRNVAYGLMSLVEIYRRLASAIAGKSAVANPVLERAERVAAELIERAAHKDDLRKRKTAVTEDRRRAYTLLFRAYEATRRALSYLRWEMGDAAAIAPALHAAPGAGRRRQSDSNGERSEVVTQLPAAAETSSRVEREPLPPGLHPAVLSEPAASDDSQGSVAQPPGTTATGFAPSNPRIAALRGVGPSEPPESHGYP